MAHEAATAQDAQFVLVNLLPDICLTPAKSGYPVPYVITHQMDQSEQCSPSVFFRGKAAYLHNESYVDNVAATSLWKAAAWPAMRRSRSATTSTEFSMSVVLAL